MFYYYVYEHNMELIYYYGATVITIHTMIARAVSGVTF